MIWNVLRAWRISRLRSKMMTLSLVLRDAYASEDAGTGLFTSAQILSLERQINALSRELKQLDPEAPSAGLISLEFSARDLDIVIGSIQRIDPAVHTEEDAASIENLMARMLAARERVHTEPE